jgi:hypothetical protein
MAQPVLGGEGDAAAQWGREKIGKKTAGVAFVFGLRKKGTAVGLVSCVSGRQRCLGREGERRPEEGRGLLAFGAKITKQGPTTGKGRCWFCFQREGAVSPWLGEERPVSKKRKGFGWRLREKKPRVTTVRGTVW